MGNGSPSGSAGASKSRLEWIEPTTGGNRPVWSRDGKELFYISQDGNLMAVEVKSGEKFEPSLPKPMFEVRTAPISTFDVSPDGKRFLIITQREQAATLMTVVVNWQSALPRR